MPLPPIQQEHAVLFLVLEQLCTLRMVPCGILWELFQEYGSLC